MEKIKSKQKGHPEPEKKSLTPDQEQTTLGNTQQTVLCLLYSIH